MLEQRTHNSKVAVVCGRLQATHSILPQGGRRKKRV
jgi:hypothetical protein